jgi:hypothetical protein
VLGALGSDADDDFGRGDDLESGRVVFTDPRFVEPEAVH